MIINNPSPSFRFHTAEGVITPRGRGPLPRLEAIALHEGGFGSVGAWGNRLPRRPPDRLLEKGPLLKEGVLLRDGKGEREVDIHLVKVTWHRWCSYRERWVSTVQWGEGIALPNGGWAVPVEDGHRWKK